MVLFRYIRPFLVGRELGIIDRIIFRISNRQTSQWVIANKSMYYLQKTKHVSELPLIIVCGFPRSGTTLLQMLLNLFEETKGPYQEVNIFEMSYDRKNVAKAFDLSYEDIEHMWRKSNKDIILFADMVLTNYMRKEGITSLVLKKPHYIFFIDELLLHYPNIKIIHIIRDGRDAVLSATKFLSEEIKEKFPFDWCVRQWAVCITRGKKYRNNQKYLEIRYEDLVNDPYYQLKYISSFLNKPMPTKEAIHNFQNYIDTEKIPSTHRKQITKNIYKQSIGTWKIKMTKEQRTTFKKIAGDILIELGYEKDNLW